MSRCLPGGDSASTCSLLWWNLDYCKSNTKYIRLRGKGTDDDLHWRAQWEHDQSGEWLPRWRTQLVGSLCWQWWCELNKAVHKWRDTAINRSVYIREKMFDIEQHCWAIFNHLSKFFITWKFIPHLLNYFIEWCNFSRTNNNNILWHSPWPNTINWSSMRHIIMLSLRWVSVRVTRFDNASPVKN